MAERIGKVAIRTAFWLGLCLFFLPLALSMVADWILQANGCSFDLKSGTHCSIAGSNWGTVLGGIFLWGRAIAFGLGVWISVAAALVWLVATMVAAATGHSRRGWTND